KALSDVVLGEHFDMRAVADLLGIQAKAERSLEGCELAIDRCRRRTRDSLLSLLLLAEPIFDIPPDVGSLDRRRPTVTEHWADMGNKLFHPGERLATVDRVFGHEVVQQLSDGDLIGPEVDGLALRNRPEALIEAVDRIGRQRALCALSIRLAVHVILHPINLTA